MPHLPSLIADGRIEVLVWYRVYRADSNDVVCQPTQKWLETLAIVVAVLVTFSAGHLDLSVVVIIATASCRQSGHAAVTHKYRGNNMGVMSC
ncbi:hypothetical protein LZ023_39230 (plasmid) [Pseudomonas silvicola]|nr:hypothetical protein LZ023_39230 [Pseudomonas silvicola]